MKKLLIVGLILVAGCSTQEAEPEPEEEKESPQTEETSQQEQDSIAVDKGVFNVEVTMPMALFEMDETDFEEVKASAEEEGVGEVVNNGDGTITYKMSKSKHEEMMSEMEQEIETAMTDIRESGDYVSINDITANKDYSEFTMVVERKKYEESFDGFAIFGVGVLGSYYQLFDGADPESYSTVIHIVDEASGEEFETIRLPEAFEEMGEVEQSG
ncbi:hypothetical protein [Salimicrobium halophilum]|uniref:Antigen I/II N-terminal domain-containing protein n=1 Tax=Salimicrobium halophilum TaxID=86666 RepID=A0A1G8S6L0_9BACI|nr:hypothetical protein [Salimicrobium halophilum]SDJ24811.1 hypothetical protein SAMN04490247_1277 [Salimicrobium halophilum]